MVSDSTGTYNVTYEVMNGPQAAQARYQELVNGYVVRGYTMMQQNSTSWSGFNFTSSMGAGVSYGTSPLMPVLCDDDDGLFRESTNAPATGHVVAHVG